MDTRRCLKIADRIDVLLQVELGCGIDLQRMLAEPLYARDVLLVCDAHRGHELATLAREFRAAHEDAAEESVPPSGWGGATSGFAPSTFDAFRPSEGASLPPQTLGQAARADEQRRTRDAFAPWRWLGGK